jgi:NitT/TauT family transport system permease protein
MKRAFDILFPALLGAALVALWQWTVTAKQIPTYVLPSPLAIAEALFNNFASLMGSLFATLRVTVEAFVAAVIAGVAVAVLFSQSRLAERALYPYAVILQVTPVVAIAPLILIWVGFDRVETALVLIAALVAFFPILSNTTLGLKSADFNLMELMRLYGASRWQILWRLQLPNALPYLLGALKIAGGLALIGAVVAEFVAGSGTATGLAWRIVEAGNRLEIATMFAALALLASLGVAIFAALSGLEYLLLRRWHESALKRSS